MTEYEIHDLAIGAMGNLLASFTLFLSILTAYIAIAYFAGKDLSRSQLFVATGLYLFAAATVIYMNISIILRIRSYVGNLADYQTTPHAIGISSSEIAGMVALFSTAVLSSLYFMWSTRRGPSKK